MTFEALLTRAASTAYAEPDFPLHKQIIAQVIPHFEKQLPRNASVLDIGCGPGSVAKMLKEFGHLVTCISIIPEEIERMKALGFSAHYLDMHYIRDLRQTFDAVIARHVLEHSPVPFAMALAIFDVLKRGGIVYVEVPAPETACHHEANPNHWSCLTINGWYQQFSRAGFSKIMMRAIDFQIPNIGNDTYYQLIVCKA